jgi:hypothetical protein
MRTKTLLACGLLLMQLSCAKKTPEVKAAPNGVDLQTVLQEPGAEPREKLRFKRANGLTENLVVEIGLATLIETKNAAGVAQAPVLALGLTMGAVSCAEGDEPVCSYPFRFRVIGVKMPEGATEEQAAEAAKAVAPLGGVSGMFEVDARGITKRADVIVPEGVSPRLLTLLGNVRTSLISVPLPEEAVGVGARWEVQRLHRVGNIEATQTLTYSLVERQDRLLRLAVTLRQTAKPQEIKLEEGTTFKLDSFETSGTGSMVMNLDAITPLGEIGITSELRGDLKNGTQVEPVAVAGKVQVVVAPLPPDSPN